MERGISFRSHYTHGMAENTLADFLSAAIKERGWSIRELARRLDISHTHVGRIISGESHPSTSLCYRISDVLQIPYETIMNFEDLRLATVETVMMRMCFCITTGNCHNQ
jgi:transcriptional regulator with XRE-family HTH domain